MQVGMTKDQGSYNKPSAAVHPGALAAGTLPKYNKIQKINNKRQLRYEFLTFRSDRYCLRSNGQNMGTNMKVIKRTFDTHQTSFF